MPPHKGTCQTEHLLGAKMLSRGGVGAVFRWSCIQKVLNLVGVLARSCPPSKEILCAHLRKNFSRQLLNGLCLGRNETKDATPYHFFLHSERLNRRRARKRTSCKLKLNTVMTCSCHLRPSVEWLLAGKLVTWTEVAHFLCLFGGENCIHSGECFFLHSYGEIVVCKGVLNMYFNVNFNIRAL